MWWKGSPEPRRYRSRLSSKNIGRLLPDEDSHASNNLTIYEELGLPQINQQLGIDQCNCFAVRKAAGRISRLYDPHVEVSGRPNTQFVTLAALDELGDG